MPIYIIPVLVAIALTIVTVGVGLLVIHGVYGEVDLKDVKILILLCALFFGGLPAVAGLALLV